MNEGSMRNMSSPSASSAFSFAIGLAAGLSVNAIVAFVQRPVLEIASDDDRYDPKFLEHYLHVRVRNKRSRIFNRNMAIDCESQVWVADAETGQMQEGSPFKTKWARLTNLVYVESTKRVEWLPIPALETRIDIYPGHSDGGKEGLQLDIIRQASDGCWVNDPEIYRLPVNERQKRYLKLGTYFVQVKILCSQKSYDPAVFLFTNTRTFDTTTLVSCPLDKLDSAKKIFGLTRVQSHPMNFDSKKDS